MDSVLFFSTSAQAKSLLDFPLEVRNKIYEHAIYDYDRGAVYLPRAVPRKVDYETDVDVKQCLGEDDDAGDADFISEGPGRRFEWPENVGKCQAAGRWATGQECEEEDVEDGSTDDTDELAEDEVAQGSETADETSLENEDQSDIEDEETGYAIEQALESRVAGDADPEALLEGVSMLKLCRDMNGRVCSCPCHDGADEATSDGESYTGSDASSDEGSDTEEGEDKGENAAPPRVDANQEATGEISLVNSIDQQPQNDNDHEATPGNQQAAGTYQDELPENHFWNCPNSSLDQLCRCPCHPEVSEVGSESEVSTHTLPTDCREGVCEGEGCEFCDPNEPTTEPEEFIELRDLEERVGMLYNRREPHILRACKQIREECLPIYYGTNTFS